MLMFCGEVVVVVQEIFYYHKGINAIFLIVYPSVSGTTQCVNNVVSTVYSETPIIRRSRDRGKAS